MLRPPVTPLDELILLVEDLSGVVVQEHDRGPLERLALEQAGRLGCDGLESYVALLRLRREGAEWQALLTRITVKESYLFRAPQQLRGLAEDVVPRLLAGRPLGGPLRVWSAGCARGEEPTTLAMVLAESPHLAGREWSILATDVDESALSDARLAVFGRRAVASVPPPLRQRYMVHQGGGTYALADRLRARIEYRVVNLVRRPLPLPEAPFDLIFLRNVLIYFRPEQQRRVVEAVVEGLAPDGYLFLGPAESLWQLQTGLVPVDLGDCFCYRLPGPQDDRPEPAQGPVAPGGDDARGPGEGSGVAVEETLEAASRAAPPWRRSRRPSAPDLDPILDALSRRDLESAGALVRHAISDSPDSARLRALQGLVAEVTGDQRTAVRCYRAALYLDPRLYQVRYLLGRCLERTGWREQARRAFREALTSVEQRTPGVEIPGGGLVGLPSASQVVTACQRALQERPTDDHG